MIRKEKENIKENQQAAVDKNPRGPGALRCLRMSAKQNCYGLTECGFSRLVLTSSFFPKTLVHYPLLFLITDRYKMSKKWYVLVFETQHIANFGQNYVIFRPSNFPKKTSKVAWNHTRWFYRETKLVSQKNTIFLNQRYYLNFI